MEKIFQLIMVIVCIFVTYLGFANTQTTQAPVLIASGSGCGVYMFKELIDK